MAKKKKIRVDLRKNRSKPPRSKQWTRGFQEHGFHEEATPTEERVRAKGELSRRRTIIQEEPAEGEQAGQEPATMPSVDSSTCLPGRVLCVHGLASVVETEDGRQFRCAVRRLLRISEGDRIAFVSKGGDVVIQPIRTTLRDHRGSVPVTSEQDFEAVPDRDLLHDAGQVHAHQRGGIAFRHPPENQAHPPVAQPVVGQEPQRPGPHVLAFVAQLHLEPVVVHQPRRVEAPHRPQAPMVHFQVVFG